MADSPNSPDQILRDQDFFRLAHEDRVSVLSTVDPEFGKLSPDDQRSVFDQAQTRLPAAGALPPRLPMPQGGNLSRGVNIGDKAQILAEDPAGTQPPSPDIYHRAADFIKDFVGREILRTVDPIHQWKQPYAQPSRLLPAEQPGESPLLSGARGFAQQVEGAATPLNAGVGAGLVALGGAGAVGAAIAKGAAVVFGGLAVKGVVDKGTSGYQKLQAGDVNGAAKDWGMGTADGLFAALAARAAFRGMPEVARGVRDSWQTWRGAGGGSTPPAPETPPAVEEPTVEPPTPEAPKPEAPKPEAGEYTEEETQAGWDAWSRQHPTHYTLEDAPDEVLTEALKWWDQNGRPGAPEGGGGGGQTPAGGGHVHYETHVDPETGELTFVEVKTEGAPPDGTTPGSHPEAATSLIDAILDDMSDEGGRAEGEVGGTLGADTPLEDAGVELPEQPKTPAVVQEPVPSPAPIVPVAKKEEHAVPEGQATVTTATGTKAPVTYRVVEASDLTASHDQALGQNPDYPQDLQPRDRGRIASEQQIQDIMAKLDPAKLGADRAADRGAPIVATVDGKQVVVSGNGRTIALQRLYEQGHDNATSYHQWLYDHAEDFGLDPEDVAGMKRPVLVRDMGAIPAKRREWLTQFAQQANEDDKAQLSASEQAKADAKRMSPALMEMFQPHESGDIVHPGNREFLRSFFGQVVPQGERGPLMDKEGEISQAGVTRVRNAVFAFAYGADTKALEKLAESSDSNIRNVTTAMIQAAPAFAKMRDGIRSGELHDADLSGDVAAAAGKLSELRESGQTVPDYLAQIGLFGEDLSQEAKALLAFFHEHRGHPKRMAALLRNYARAVEAAGSPKQESMFGGGALSKQDALAAAILATEKEFHEGTRPTPGASLFDEGQSDQGPGAPKPDEPAPEPKAGGEAGGEQQGQPAAHPIGGGEGHEAGGATPNPHPERPGSDAGGKSGSADEQPEQAKELDHISSGTRNLKLIRAAAKYVKAHPDATAGELGAHLKATMPASGPLTYSLAAYVEYAASFLDIERERRGNRTKPAKPAPEAPDATGLTSKEIAFIEACYERLSSDRGIKDNLALAGLANVAFGGTRHSGAWDIKQVYDLLEAAVAKWVMNYQHVTSPEGMLAGVRYMMEKHLPRQVDRTEGQLAYQQFSTPPTIALVASVAAGLRASDVAMEPSAGTGMLAAWAKVAGVAQVLTNEIDPRRLAILRYLGFDPTAHDGEQLHNLTDAKPTVVIMNPPFSAAGNRGITKDQEVWKRHVDQALETLAEGGRLVAILPGGRGGHPGEGAALDGAAADWWNATMAKYNVRASLLIDGKEYGKYGTTFATRLVVIDKTGATPGENPVAQRANVEQNSDGSLENVLDVARQLGQSRPEIGNPQGDLGPSPGGAGGVGPGAGGRPAHPRPGGRPGSAKRGGPGGVPAPLPAPEPEHPGGQPGPPAPEPSGGGHPEGGKPRTPVKHKIPPVEPGVNLAAQQQTEAGGTYVHYLPAKLKGGAPHPAPIVQPAALAAVDPPDITYMPKFDPAIITEGRISNVQLEAVCYAGQRHERILPTGARAGIFIGDGTGVGKGREIAAIVADNWAQGRRRAIWTSVSADLIEDARRDLKDLGLDIPIRVVNDWKATQDIDLGEGIVFLTYASLIGEGKETDEAKGGGENAPVVRRVDQLAKWLGEEGVIVFDEAHKAKNAWDSGMGKPTQTGLAVLDIQAKLPMARVVYASATGATEVKNMAYMTRLGLWGKATSFTEFVDFVIEIEGGGVGAMEMVARDLKARGAYMARTISYEGVGYRERVHGLSPEQRKMYDVASNAWLQVIHSINAAIAQTHAPGMARAKATSQFWAGHQRFFKQLITAIKVPTCIDEIEKALSNDSSVVISLFTTGEAQQKRMLQKVREAGGDLEGIDWTPREVLDRLIVQVFPIHAYEEVKVNGKKVIQAVLDADGKHVVDKQALAMREALRDSLSDMALPGNPIDLIIEHFAKKGIGVAELTGRKERIEQNKLTGKKEVKKRKAEGVAADKTSLAEVAAFQDGTKRIAIISDSASTGISLHASNRAKNKQKRVHIALELKWSADKQLQDFGRTHRSDQAQPPEYVLLSVDIGGDKRFSATIARRLGSLGALTKGSREASGAGEIAKYNFETQYGRTALTALLNHAQKSEEGKQTLADMGLLKRDPQTKEPVGVVDPKDLADVAHFLNRVLSLPVDRQNELFDAFVLHFGQAIEAAKRNGTFDEGVSDLKGAVAVRLVKAEICPTNEPDGSRTWHYQFEVDEKTNPSDFEQALRWKANRAAMGSTPQGAMAPGWYVQGRSGHVVMMASSGTASDPASGTTWRNVAMLRPNGAIDHMSEDEFRGKYTPASDTLARAWWTEAYTKIPKIRTRELHLIGGAILGVWRNIQATGARGMEVVRVPLDDGRRMVGIEIPNQNVADVLKALGVGRELVDPNAIFRGVVEQGEEVQLAGAMKLRRTKIHQEPAFEIADVPSTVFSQLDAIPGIISERIDGKRRFFIPTDPATGQAVLRHVLDKFPVIRKTTGGPEFAAAPAGWDAIEGETPEDRAAKVRFKVRGNTVYVNRAGMRSILGLWGKDNSSGVTMQPIHAQAAADYLRAEASRTRRWGRIAGGGRLLLLAQALEQAGREHSRVVVVDASYSFGHVRETLRHERFHVAQHEIEKQRWPSADPFEDVPDDAPDDYEPEIHLGSYEMDLLTHPFARVAATALRLRGYGESQLTREIGAFLASGDYHALDLTRGEAKELWFEYMRMLNLAYGGVEQAVRTVAPIMRQAYETRLRKDPGAGNARRETWARVFGPGFRSDVPGEPDHALWRPEDNLDLFGPGADAGNADAEAADQARLTGDQLSAEFGSAIARPKGLKKPKPKQQDLFAPDDRPEQQPLFLLEGIRETHDELQRTFNPTARADSANTAGLSIRAQAGRAARDYARAEAALEEARDYFSRRKLPESIAFINAIEAGDPQPTPQLQGWADIIREFLDETRDAVKGLGTGKLQTFYETYFPHIWKRPQAAADAFRSIFAKRPIEGPKSFLKKRKYQSFQEGIDAGLEPVTDNAIDLVLLKLKEMERYLLAHRFLHEMKRGGLARYVPILKRKNAPAGWVELPDPIGTVWGPPHIQVKEALDNDMWEGLNRFAEHLGIPHARIATMRGGKWGWAQRSPEQIVSRYAGPESVVIHEIGHTLDYRYGLAAQLVNHKSYKAELRALADLRITPADSPSQAKYYRRGSEKIANMVAAYIHARARFERTAPGVFQWFDEFVKRTPELEELTRLEYGMGLRTRRQQYPVGGLILRGHYFMPAEAAQVVKNFLSPGLGGKPWYQAVRGLSNSMLQFALGFSGYHAGFTTFEAMTGRLALAFEELAAGHPLAALGQAVKVPVTPFTNVALGHKVMKAYLDDTITDPELREFVQGLVEGGGRVKMDEQYRTRFRQRFMDAFHKSGIGGKLAEVLGPHHLFRNVGAIAEAAAWPVMEWLVPRQKVGAFCNMARVIAKNHPMATRQELRQMYAKAWDSIDNRFGQMVYDNLLWNRVAKDLAMISVQSMGWNLGTFREIGGGMLDWLKFGVQGVRWGASLGMAPRPTLTHRMAYVLALPVMTGVLGSLMTFAGTGEAPQSVDDLFFPRTGGFDEQGHAERLSLPSYMKDVYHWGTHPLEAARNKLNPALRLAIELLQNQNFFGVQVRNPNDSLPTQALDVGKHVAQTFEPYAIRNMLQERERGASLAGQLAPQIGITAAPSYITRTAAQRKIGELIGDGRARGGEPQETFERASINREILNAIKRGDRAGLQKARDALAAGKITVRDVRRDIANARKDRDVAGFAFLSAEQECVVYRLANVEEKAKFRPILSKKIIAAKRTNTPEAFQHLVDRFSDVIEELRRRP